MEKLSVKFSTVPRPVEVRSSLVRRWLEGVSTPMSNTVRTNTRVSKMRVATISIIIVCITCFPFVGAFGVTNNSTQLCDLKTYQKRSGPTRHDGFAECPPNFSADLLKVEDGTLYGACLTIIDRQNSTNYKGASFRAMDCRKRCSQFMHAIRQQRLELNHNRPRTLSQPARPALLRAS